MASAVPMSRSRGSVSGLALVLLGAWGGLAPFVGPYFHLGYEPDQTWQYNLGRLYLVILPGGIALLSGLIILASRSRGLSGLCAVLAALAGLWFALGRTVMIFAATTTSDSYVHSLLVPIAHSARGQILTQLVSFLGVGLLIVFFAALALGRTSMGSYRDYLRFGDGTAGAVGAVGAVGVGGLANVGLASPSPTYTPYQPTSAASFDPFQPSPAPSYSPPTEQAVVGGQAKFPSQYPSTVEESADPGQHVGSGSSGSAFTETAEKYGAATNTFTPGQVTYAPGQTKYPPTQQQTNPLTAPTEEQKSPPQI